MELKLKNRDYILDGSGGVERGEGAEAVLARVLFRLSARRGAFPFLPDLGSRLHEVLREKPSARLAAAKQYVAQALEQEDVEITGVTLTDTEYGAQLRVTMLWQGEELTVQTRLEGG